MSETRSLTLTKDELTSVYKALEHEIESLALQSVVPAKATSNPENRDHRDHCFESLVKVQTALRETG